MNFFGDEHFRGMTPVQEYALNYIHASPGEDSQFRFKLVRATKPNQPAYQTVKIFNRSATDLPDKVNYYHVYIIGQKYPESMNIKTGRVCCFCPETGWVNAQEDMNSRNFILQLYDDLGRMYPRSHIYYRSTKDDNLIVAVKIDDALREAFDYEAIKYIRTYTYRYYSGELNERAVFIKGRVVRSITDTIEIKREIEKTPMEGSALRYYINGCYSSVLPLTIPKGSYVEWVIDNQKEWVETHSIKGLRTFLSKIDKVSKYFLFRRPGYNYDEKNGIVDFFKDDHDIFIAGKNKDGVEIGLYYYQNREEAVRNVSEYDISLHATYINNQARELAKMIGDVEIEDIYLKIFVKKRDEGGPGYRRLKRFNGLRLTELFKLPHETQLNLMLGSSDHLPHWRAENLEASDYYYIERTDNILSINKERSANALGYNPTHYYFGLNPLYRKDNQAFRVPELFRHLATAYEYCEEGTLLGTGPVQSDLYIPSGDDVRRVELVQGRSDIVTTLHKYGEWTDLIPNREFMVLTAAFYEGERRSDWYDVSDDPSTIREDGRITYSNGNRLGYFKIFYLDIPVTMDVGMSIREYFHPIKLVVSVLKDGLYVQEEMDFFPDTLEVFMENRRLVQGVDFAIKFPYVQIYNKEYLREGKDTVQIHIRCIGITEKEEKINGREIRGFVNRGVLAVNNGYDVIDSRVFSLFVDGKIQDSYSYPFAENTIVPGASDLPMNGRPYAIVDHYVTQGLVTGMPTKPYFDKDVALNRQIEGLFNQIYPEPSFDEFNVISRFYFLFSPLISKIIRDMKNGTLSPSVYVNNQSDLVVREVVTRDYAFELAIDPINRKLDRRLVEIHPDYTHKSIGLTFYQYRFLNDVIRIYTNGDPSIVNLSGYVYISSELD